MSSVDTQFHRAVDIVQSLPKEGPIQTTYEEKLSLYALYKQATEGDNNIARPGILDILGKAKWDSWNKQKGTEKDQAKRLYISALLKLLKKHSGRESSDKYLQKLGFTSSSESRILDPSRPVSPASSSSSYHSSQASPILEPQQSQYLPDPSLPPPDVAPSIVPPSALKSSHRSLLSLGQSGQESSEVFDRISGLGGAAGTGGLHASSRTQSMREGVEGYRPRESGPGSVQSSRQRPVMYEPRSRLGSPRIPVPPPPVQRDYIGTPDTHGGSPYLGLHQPTPTYSYSHRPGPGSASTFSQPPASINMPYTLQQIQISLTALHERLSTLERTQAMILRKDDERRKNWLFWKSEDDDIDQFEDDTARERWSGTRTGGVTTLTKKKKKSPLSLRVVWYLLRTLRRAMVDVGVGMMILLVWMVVLSGGWRRAKWVLGRVWGKWRRMITDT